MSLAVLQKAIRQKKTPLALGLCPDAEKLEASALYRRFTEIYGPTPQALAETMRYQGGQVIEAVCPLLPAAVLEADCYLRCGSVGLEVLESLAALCRGRGLYTVIDCRTTRPAVWLHVADGVTVLPYVGGSCCEVGEDKSVFAVLRTQEKGAGDVQNLAAGDRKLYQAIGEQMARRGAGMVIETGYSLDIKELRRRLRDSFFLLKNCDADNALPAFDDYGHGALVVEDTIQYAADPAAAAEEAIRTMKRTVQVL